MNKYVDQLERIFNKYSLLEQGHGKIGVQSFLKFVKDYNISGP